MVVLANFTFAQKKTWKVETQGAMRTMFQTGNIEGKTDVGQISPQKNLYAVGPLDNLSGEIMIWNGKPFISSINENKIETKIKNDAKAVFFVWATVEKWKEIKIPKTVKSYDELEKFIAESADSINLDSAEPLPFLLKGKFEMVEWHINDYKSDGEKVTHEKHDKLKYKQKSENKKLEMLGFYSPKHQGIFTHHTRTTHIHATDKRKTFIGHVDNLQIAGNIKLFLPIK